MSKTYFVQFGSGDPRTFTGLTPTLVQFTQFDGTAITGPTFTENFNVSAGVTSGTGIYKFTYSPLSPVSFLADGLTTGLGSGRYIAGVCDPADRADEFGTTTVALGNTSVALGAINATLLGTLLSNGMTISVILAGVGSTASSYGSASQDPVDLFGYLKRIQENLEGNQTFIKPSGVLNIYSRANATLLISKTVANSVSLVVKS